MPWLRERNAQVWLMSANGATYKEIAETLGMSESRVSQINRKIQTQMNRQGDRFLYRLRGRPYAEVHPIETAPGPEILPP